MTDIDYADTSLKLTLERIENFKTENNAFTLDHQLHGFVKNWIQEHFVKDTLLPRVYQTPEGGLELEWLMDRTDFSVEFDPISKTVDCHIMNLDTENVQERSLALEDVNGLNILGHFLSQELTLVY